MAASWGVHQPTTALAEGVPPALLDEADRLKRLHDWLKASGADMSLVEVRQSQAGAGAGYGMFVASGSDTKQLKRCTLSASRRRWWWPFGGSGGSLVSQAPLATFPMSRAVTAHNILRDEKLGRGYGWMLEHGVVDERTIIMAFLVVERLKGSASHLAPWIDALPTTFDTPLAFSPAELAELAGTPLHRASAVVAGRLREQWARMQPALSGLLQSQPGVARQATYDDLLWAYSVFWSRGQSLPVPARAGASSSSLLAADKDAAAHALLDVHEGIVPGLDFCNHHTATPECWWEVATPAEGGEGAAPDVGAAVQLRLYRGAGASPGDELRISYGDKSNEELLLLYGFAVQGNPHDHIMVHVPLPPSSMWDEVMHARVALLRSAGHDLQFFLPSPFPLAKGAAGSVPKGGSASPAGAGAGVPRGLLQTLEVFVLTPAELTQRLEALKRASAGRPADGDAELLQPVDLADIKRQRARMGAQELADSADRLGVRMGAVAAGVKILEHRVEELESAPQAAGSGGGSGSLEEDDALLAQWASEPRAAAAALPATERRRRACVIYRREQKAITREYLKRTRAELSDVLGTLQVERAQQRLAGKVSGLATDMSRRMDRIMSALESMGAGGGGVGGVGGVCAASMLRREDGVSSASMRRPYLSAARPPHLGSAHLGTVRSDGRSPFSDEASAAAVAEAAAYANYGSGGSGSAPPMPSPPVAGLSRSGSNVFSPGSRPGSAHSGHPRMSSIGAGGGAGSLQPYSARPWRRSVSGLQGTASAAAQLPGSPLLPSPHGGLGGGFGSQLDPTSGHWHERPGSVVSGGADGWYESGDVATPLPGTADRGGHSDYKESPSPKSRR